LHGNGTCFSVTLSEVVTDEGQQFKAKR